MVFKNMVLSMLGGVEKLNLSDLDVNIVFSGDSLTYWGGSNEQAYPKKVRDWLLTKCKSVTFNSFGVSGQSTQEMLARDTPKVSALVDPNKTNVFVGWEDVNAILNDEVTGQQNYDDFETYYQLRKNEGYEYIIHINGGYPRTPYNKTLWVTTKSEQKIYFDLCKDKKMKNVSVMIDLREDINIGGEENTPINSTYFTDSVHFTDPVGNQVIADNVVNKGLLLLFK